jgi:hypothetical protein
MAALEIVVILISKLWPLISKMCYNISMFKSLTKDSLFLDLLLNLAFFPLWWYSFGLKSVVLYAFEFLKHRESGLGLLVWFSNLLVPMYGQTDLPGRLISLIIRLMQVFFRGSIMMIWVFLALMLVILWLIAPIAVINGLMINLHV